MDPRDSPRSVRRLDSIRLDAKDTTYFTAEGYLVDHPILTSCGIFEYAQPDGSIRRELRLPEHVFAPESLKSYKGRPIIITHEASYVDKDNVSQEQIGTILSEGYRDGENVRAEIVIHDTDAMKRCGLRELSLGYNQTPIEEPGVWNGQPYDAIQTHISINHLALVASARAGDQARLNVDGSDEPELKGGKQSMNEKDTQTQQDEELTPEQLEEAIALWKAKNAEVEDPEKPTEDGTPETTTEDGDDPGKLPAGNGVEDKLAQVQDRRDQRNAAEGPSDLEEARSVIARQDEDLDTLMACLDALMKEKTQADCDTTKDCAPKGSADSSDDESQSLNADSADEIVRQRLSLCRVGDRLNLDGLEDMSLMDGKRAIIAKVLPNIRLDGKSSAYVNACYDIAVSEVGKRKDVNYQRRQMASGAPQVRSDGITTSMAAAARQRMLNREGGNQ